MVNNRRLKPEQGNFPDAAPCLPLRKFPCATLLRLSPPVVIAALSLPALQQFDMSQPICGYCDVKRVWTLNMVSLPSVDFGKQRGIVTRFAPSPNGALHLGHAFSAMCARDFARANSGAFHLRIEDIDGTRSRAEHVGTILSDLAWLGLGWDGPVQYQSGRVARYLDALEELKAMKLVYRCTCSRGQIGEALKTAAVPHGPDGPHYPGTCRGREVADDVPHSWRLDMAKAAALAGPLRWADLAAGEAVCVRIVDGKRGRMAVQVVSWEFAGRQ